MPTETIKVAGTEGPKTGKTRGRIKAEDGRLFQAAPVILDSVRIGSVYDIGYKDDEYNGTKFRVIESLAPSIGQVAAPVQNRTAPAGGFSAGPREAPIEDERGTDIATLAIAKVWLEKVPVGDEVGCLHALRVARRAWLKFKANPNNVESGRQPPMEDEVPYDR
jgi:hypothetical protein